MRYAWIERHQKRWPITLQCEVLNVSASGYFEHQRRKDSGRPATSGKRISDEALLVHIKAAHAASKGEYGWPRIWQERRANGVRVGKEQVRRLMKLHDIKARGKRKYVVTTDSKHDLPIALNSLNRNFQPDAPNSVWTSDITYIQTDEGWEGFGVDEKGYLMTPDGEQCVVAVDPQIFPPHRSRNFARRSNQSKGKAWMDTEEHI